LIWTRSPAPAAPALHKQNSSQQERNFTGRMIRRHLGERNPRFFMEQCNLRKIGTQHRYYHPDTKLIPPKHFIPTHAPTRIPTIHRSITKQLTKCEERTCSPPHQWTRTLYYYNNISRRKFPTFFFSQMQLVGAIHYTFVSQPISHSTNHWNMNKSN
jgi:hypothetical protein